MYTVDPKIYRRSAIVFSRSFDKVISTRRDRSRSMQALYDLKFGAVLNIRNSKAGTLVQLVMPGKVMLERCRR